jgi:hypothetical protein
MIHASTDWEIAAPFVSFHLACTTIIEHPSQIIGIQRAIEHGERKKNRHGVISYMAHHSLRGHGGGLRNGKTKEVESEIGDGSYRGYASNLYHTILGL